MAMKYQFGTRSELNLAECSFSLQRIARETLALGIIDFAVIEGQRPKEVQDRYCAEGKSRVKWPDSKHNKKPSEALDAAPFVNGKISWEKEHCCVLADVMLAVARKHGVNLRWSGNWDQDGEPVIDQDFQDLVHYEEIG